MVDLLGGRKTIVTGDKFDIGRVCDLLIANAPKVP